MKVSKGTGVEMKKITRAAAVAVDNVLAMKVTFGGSGWRSGIFACISLAPSSV
ncbi:hypothetical protein Tco_1513930, partial [Tanacetum coccineum]